MTPAQIELRQYLRAIDLDLPLEPDATGWWMACEYAKRGQTTFQRAGPGLWYPLRVVSVDDMSRPLQPIWRFRYF